MPNFIARAFLCFVIPAEAGIQGRKAGRTDARGGRMMPADVAHYNGCKARESERGSRPMKRNAGFRSSLVLLAIIIEAAAPPATAQSYESYGVFCANGRIAVELAFRGADGQQPQRLPAAAVPEPRRRRELRPRQFRRRRRLLLVPLSVATARRRCARASAPVAARACAAPRQPSRATTAKGGPRQLAGWRAPSAAREDRR